MKLVLFLGVALLVLFFYIRAVWGDVFEDSGWDRIGKDRD